MTEGYGDRILVHINTNFDDRYQELMMMIMMSELFVLTSSCPDQHSLRPASRGDYVIPRSRTAMKQHKAFSTAGLAIRNFPTDLRSLPRDLSGTLYGLLKTFLFARAWAGRASE